MIMKGVKHDTEKVRIELFPGDVLFAISDILTFGAKKYASRNWEHGMEWGRVFGALMRHMWSWWQGKAPTNENFVFGELDTETGRSHLWHAGCCMAFLIAFEMRGVGIDDRPSKETDAKSDSDTVVERRVPDVQKDIQQKDAYEFKRTELGDLYRNEDPRGQYVGY